MTRFPLAPARRPGGPAGGAASVRAPSERDDYRYVEDVVRIGFPVRDARLYLARHLGNPVVYKLVEASATTCRLEKVGQEQSRDGKPITAKAAPTSSQGAPHSGRCSTLAGSAASVLAGLGLLLGLTRRKGPAAG